MNRKVYECAFCATMTAGFSIGALTITILAMLGILG
jgi:hypothetical protein